MLDVQTVPKLVPHGVLLTHWLKSAKKGSVLEPFGRDIQATSVTSVCLAEATPLKWRLRLPSVQGR